MTKPYTLLFNYNTSNGCLYTTQTNPAYSIHVVGYNPYQLNVYDGGNALGKTNGWQEAEAMIKKAMGIN